MTDRKCITRVTSVIIAGLMISFSLGRIPVAAADEIMSATDAAGAIGAGWNLGNTLDSYGTWISASGDSADPYETAWGNPSTTKAMIDSVKEQGFNAVRIPVTWSQHIDGSGHVMSGWMNRVKEVVDYAYDDGLYVILNVHHDTGEGGGDKVAWVFAETSNYDQNKAKYQTLWTEIATEFKDYGGRLMFEGYNEMMDSGNTWNAPRSNSSYQAVNDYAQLFVDTVRSTGGNNATRNLIVNTYVSSVDQAVLDNFVLPSDSAKGHLLCEVHVYSPWGFTGTSQSVTWTSVHNDFGQSDKDEIDDIMRRLKAFSDRLGVPVIIGEYGAEFKNNEDQISLYANYFVGMAGQNGIKCFYWDNGDYKTSGEGGYAIFDRKNMTWKTSITEAITKAAAAYVTEVTDTEETGETSAETTVETTVETTAGTSEETSGTEAASTSAPAAAATSAAAAEKEGGSGSLVPFIVVDAVLVAGAVGLTAYYLVKRKQA
ncbi:endoglucanase [Ruminococcaceae bacterium YRB3002]|nr:endoglucanase [Ruminococcaceae bacterium YRB3002]